MSRELIQQGDVLVVKIDVIPPDAAKVSSSGGWYVLVEGEHTGHTHKIEDSGKVEVFVTPEGRRFLKVLESLELYHDTHLPRIILPGLYEIERIKEVDPFTEEIHTVTD